MYYLTVVLMLLHIVFAGQQIYYLGFFFFRKGCVWDLDITLVTQVKFPSIVQFYWFFLNTVTTAQLPRLTTVFSCRAKFITKNWIIFIPTTAVFDWITDWIWVEIKQFKNPWITEWNSSPINFRLNPQNTIDGKLFWLFHWISSRPLLVHLTVACHICFYIGPTCMGPDCSGWGSDSPPWHTTYQAIQSQQALILSPHMGLCKIYFSILIIVSHQVKAKRSLLYSGRDVSLLLCLPAPFFSSPLTLIF